MAEVRAWAICASESCSCFSSLAFNASVCTAAAFLASSKAALMADCDSARAFVVACSASAMPASALALAARASFRSFEIRPARSSSTDCTSGRLVRERMM